MIKINLSKKGTQYKSTNDSSSDLSMSSSETTGLRKTAMVRAALIILGPISLLMFEQQTLPKLQAQLKRANQELTAVTEKNIKAAEAVIQTKKFKHEQEVLQTHINSIEDLKKNRLREVRLLDFIQKDLPDKLWLTRMEMSAGKLNIQGLSTTDGELTQFMDALSRSAYLKEVSLIRSTDHNSDEVGQLKKFEISCLMETAE